MPRSQASSSWRQARRSRPIVLSWEPPLSQRCRSRLWASPLIQPMDGALYLANISVLPDASKRGVGGRLLERVIAHARATQATAVTLATFRAPPCNGPWFRRQGFTIMPESEIGAGLRAVLIRHGRFLDMQTHETLWFPIITVPSVVQNS